MISTKPMAATQTAFDFSASVPAERGPARPAAVSPARAKKPKQATASPESEHSQLEAALRSALALPVRITLTDNRRTMISLERSPRVVNVRLHHMFASADAHTLRALGLYLAHADRDAAQQIGRYIEQNRTSIRARRARPVQLSAVGLHYDLQEIYQDVNARYFGGCVEAKISWSRDAQLGRRARSIKLGSYLARDKLIRVHPALDAEFVPRYFVEYIVYHEMLHHVLPPRRAGKRRSLHGPEFQKRERDFEDFEAALCWERENLDRLLSRG